MPCTHQEDLFSPAINANHHGTHCDEIWKCCGRQTRPPQRLSEPWKLCQTTPLISSHGRGHLSPGLFGPSFYQLYGCIQGNGRPQKPELLLLFSAYEGPKTAPWVVDQAPTDAFTLPRGSRWCGQWTSGCFPFSNMGGTCVCFLEGLVTQREATLTTSSTTATDAEVSRSYHAHITHITFISYTYHVHIIHISHSYHTYIAFISCTYHIHIMHISRPYHAHITCISLTYQIISDRKHTNRCRIICTKRLSEEEADEQHKLKQQKDGVRVSMYRVCMIHACMQQQLAADATRQAVSPRAFAAWPLGPAPRVTRPSCSRGAPEHRSIPSVMASRPQGRQGSLISDERGSLEPGRAVANVCSSGASLAVVCSIERKGCGSTQGQQELAMA